jgi:hypothetical protein
VEDAIVDAIKIRWGSGTGGFRPETIEYPAPGRLKLWYQDPGWDHVAHYRPRAKWGPRRIETNQCATMELDVDDDGGIGVIVNIGGWTDMMVNVQFLLRENGRLTGPDGKVTALQPGGRTFTACAGAYELAGPAGGRLRICGLPESEARCGIGDSRTITGLAETRCHRLIVCCFTPVRLSFRLEPAR